MSGGMTDTTSLYDIHMRVHPDGTWGASYQNRRVVTIDGAVVMDSPLAQMPIDPRVPEDMAAITAVIGEAATTALAINTTLQATNGALQDQIADLTTQNGALQASNGALQTQIATMQAEIDSLNAAPSDDPAAGL